MSTSPVNTAIASPRAHLVDLAGFRDEPLRTYTGRAAGLRVRAQTYLDDLDVDPGVDQIIVRVPDDTWDLSSGFWSGLFGGSVRRLRARGFRARYRFEGGVIREEDVDAGIEDAIFEENPLADPHATIRREQHSGISAGSGAPA